MSTQAVSRRRDLEVALRLADLAADAALRAFRSPHLGVDRKADGGVVTTADLEIERILRDELERSCPTDAVLGEEFGASGEGARVWTLDPIDGTAGFVDGNTEWATLIALVEEGVPVVGVVSRPAREIRWWAGQGLGAFRNGRPVHVSGTRRLTDAVLLEDFRCSVGRRLSSNPMLALGSACAGVHPWLDLYDVLRVADGSVDIALLWHAGSGPDLYPWACVIAEAGGRQSDLRGAIDVDASVQVATNGWLHDEALEFLNDLIANGIFDPSIEPIEDIPAIKAARRLQSERIVRLGS